jgi:putative transposase
MKRNASLDLDQLQDTLVSHIPLLEDGQTQEESIHIDCHRDTELLGSKMILQLTRSQDQSSCTQESQVTNKKTTCKGKNNILKADVKQKSIPTFKISHPDSISKEKDLSRFWTPSKKARYDQLSWLPKIDWQGLDSTSSNGYATSTEQKSWFSITKIQHQPKNLEKTCYPSYKYTVVGGMEVEDTTRKIIKTLKLKIVPSKEQKKILDKWSNASRFTYNKTVGCLNNPKNNCINWQKLRNRFVTAKNRKGVSNNFFSNKKWLLETPKSIRLSAVQEATKNLKACFTSLRNKNIKGFNIRYKAKKKEMKNGWSIGLEKNNVSKDGDKLTIFSDKLGVVRYRGTKQLHKLIPGNKPDKDPRLQKDRFGDYYLLIVVEKAIKHPPNIHKSVRSYDPGVKVYLTGYDPKGEATIIGKGCDETIIKMLEKLDGLISLKSTVLGCNYNIVNRKIIKLRKKIFNLKNELHNQVNNIVAKSSTLVLYPKLDVPRLTLQETRTLKTKTVRQMLHLGHCEGYEKLKQKCKEHGCQLLTVSEAYTTKTCCCCGALNNCSNDRIFSCSCGYMAERDINGAQNILLRSMES